MAFILSFRISVFNKQVLIGLTVQNDFYVVSITMGTYKTEPPEKIYFLNLILFS